MGRTVLIEADNNFCICNFFLPQPIAPLETKRTSLPRWISSEHCSTIAAILESAGRPCEVDTMEVPHFTTTLEASVIRTVRSSERLGLNILLTQYFVLAQIILNRTKFNFYACPFHNCSCDTLKNNYVYNYYIQHCTN